MAGGLLRGWRSALALALIAAPFAGAPSEPLVLVAALALTGLVFAALGMITGVWADTFDQHAFIANLVISPPALLGGVFYATDPLHQPWRTLTRADPLLPRRRHAPRLGRRARGPRGGRAARRAGCLRRRLRPRRGAGRARPAAQALTSRACRHTLLKKFRS
jgi:hypothetical protein